MALRKACWTYDQGAADYREDICIARYPFYGIVDGFSEPHSHLKPALLFNGMSGGEMIAEISWNVFNDVSPHLSPKEIVPLINILIEKILNKQQGITVSNAGAIPGASFILAKISEKKVELVQAGDCLAVWQLGSGEIGFTKNQAYAHVNRNLRIINKILDRNGNNWDEMWVEFSPILSQRRQKDINNPKSANGYAVLNGQPDMTKCWQAQEIPVQTLRRMILFSDGFIHYHDTSDEKIAGLAESLLFYSQKLELAEMLAIKRIKEAKDAKTSFIAYDEASVILLEFDHPKPELEEETIQKALYHPVIEGNLFRKFKFFNF